MSQFRRYAESPGHYMTPPAGPSVEACIAARSVVNLCVSPALFEPQAEPRAKRRTKRAQSAKQKKHTAQFGKRMRACGKKWNAKTPAAKAKTTWKEFQARHCQK